jgi:hypothetical protein
MATVTNADVITAESITTMVLTEPVDILLPNQGVFTVTHAVIDGEDVLVTNDPSDTDVDLPAHIFKFFTELQLSDHQI